MMNKKKCIISGMGIVFAILLALQVTGLGIFPIAKISKKQSKEIAFHEAERFLGEIASKNGLEYRLVKTSIGKKKLSIGTKKQHRYCWEWKLTYQWIDEENPDAFHMDPVFSVDVDINTGEIINNTNNYT